MSQRLSIRPSRDLRTHYAQISAEAKEHPVAITVNGKEDTVLISHEEYMDQQQHISELEAKLKLYAHLAQSADDVKLGRVQSMNEALDDIIGEIENL